MSLCRKVLNTYWKQLWLLKSKHTGSDIKRHEMQMDMSRLPVMAKAANIPFIQVSASSKSKRHGRLLRSVGRAHRLWSHASAAPVPPACLLLAVCATWQLGRRRVLLVRDRRPFDHGAVHRLPLKCAGCMGR